LLFSQILWGFGGETPIIEEEGASPDDERKDLRLSAPFKSPLTRAKG
jgi:hypothetical protein